MHILKILIITLFVCVIGINTVIANTYNDTFTHIGEGYSSYSSSDTTQLAGKYYINSIYANDITQMSGLSIITMTSYAAYTDESVSNYDNVVLYIDDQPVGTGIYGYNWNPQHTKLYVHLFVTSDGLNISGLSGSKVVTISPSSVHIGGWHLGSQYYTDIGTLPSGSDKVVFRSAVGTYAYNGGVSSYNVQISYKNYFDFTYTDDYGINKFDMLRNTSHTSQTNISINNNPVYVESELKSYNISYINSSYDFWDITNTNLFGDIQHKRIYFNQIYNDNPYIITDKPSYNLSETITISYGNIDKYAYNNSAYWRYPLQFSILYFDVQKNKYWPVYQNLLYWNLQDETWTFDTDFLTPANHYYVAVHQDGGFQPTDWMVSSEFSIIDTDIEYLSVSCGVVNNCYTYNGEKLTIRLNINNNSVLKLYDNDDKLIQSWNNIIGTKQITYIIPSDTNQLNSYPYWYLTLNNTEYNTSFKSDLEVFYTEFTKPTVEPTYTALPINQSIDDQITELKDGFKPLKDFMFGLSEIVIDNPDYDNDNVVSQNEFSNWINGLVSIVLVLFIIIMYIGLTDRKR